MTRWARGFACTAGTLLTVLGASIVYATPMTISLGSGTSFQNEGTIRTGDVTGLLATKNDQWAPRPIGSAGPNFYATGTNGSYFDAVSLFFDLSAVDAPITSASLRFYIQKGTYTNTWGHYEVLEGPMNVEDQDLNPVTGTATGSIQNFGDGFASNAVIGWIEVPIDSSWITSDSFSTTLRLWNARIDVTELVLDLDQGTTNPVPEPGTMMLLGSGLLGLAGMARRRGPGRGQTPTKS